MTPRCSEPRGRLPAFAMLLHVCLAVIPAFSWVASGAELQSPKKDATLILQSANSNENSYNNGEFISILRGNVVFQYDDIRIKSDEATWWRNQGVVDFRNHVRVTQKSQIITCDRMHFEKVNNTLEATGKFYYRDTAEQSELMGEKATYRLDTKHFTLTGKPRLVRFDTAAAETLIIKGRVMVYADSLKRADVADSVTITKGKLVSRCDKAAYFTDKNYATLRGKPRVNFDIHEVVGDSIDLYFGKESLRGASVYGSAHGMYIDTAGKTLDTAYTHVWGDSLYMSVSDAGNLDSLWVSGKAISKYYMSASSDVVNQANGKTMLISFGRDGDVDKVKIWGNARSTYFIEEKDSRGVNEASGDSITVEFRNGKAVFLNLAGAARGIFFPHGL